MHLSIGLGSLHFIFSNADIFCSQNSEPFKKFLKIVKICIKFQLSNNVFLYFENSQSFRGFSPKGLSPDHPSSIRTHSPLLKISAGTIVRLITVLRCLHIPCLFKKRLQLDSIPFYFIFPSETH